MKSCSNYCFQAVMYMYTRVATRSGIECVTLCEGDLHGQHLPFSGVMGTYIYMVSACLGPNDALASVF